MAHAQIFCQIHAYLIARAPCKHRSIFADTMTLLSALLPCLLLISARADVGKSTYAMSHPFAYKAFMETYFPVAENVVEANSTKDCVEWVKLCLDVKSCSGPSPSITQIHSVGAYERDSGNLTLQELESMFTAALGGMKKYDPFMELTLGLYTADLDSFVKAFEGASPKIAYFPSTFTTAAGKRFYSIQVQVPGSLDASAGSLLLLELVSDLCVLWNCAFIVWCLQALQHYVTPLFY